MRNLCSVYLSFSRSSLNKMTNFDSEMQAIPNCEMTSFEIQTGDMHTTVTALAGRSRCDGSKGLQHVIVEMQIPFFLKEKQVFIVWKHLKIFSNSNFFD